VFFDRATLFKERVEFEDIDAGGVVHHPRYFNFYERARSSGCRESGLSFDDFMKKGFTFALVNADICYRKPLRYEDEFFVISQSLDLRASSLKIAQWIVLEEPALEDLQGQVEEKIGKMTLVNSLKARMVCVSVEGLRAVKVPHFWKKSFGFSN